MKMLPNLSKSYIRHITFCNFEDKFPWRMDIRVLRYYPKDKDWGERIYRKRRPEYKYQRLINKYRNNYPKSGMIDLSLPVRYITIYFEKPIEKFKRELFIKLLWLVAILSWLYVILKSYIL